MLTGLEDNILSFEWILAIVTNVTFRGKKKKVEIILFSLLFSSCSRLPYGHKEMIEMDWHKVGFPVSFRVMFSALSTLIGSVLRFENSSKRAENIRKHNSLYFLLNEIVSASLNFAADLYEVSELCSWKTVDTKEI